MALRTEHISTEHLRPPGLLAGINGSISSHWSWVRLVEYDLLIVSQWCCCLYLLTAYALRAFFT